MPIKLMLDSNKIYHKIFEGTKPGYDALQVDSFLDIVIKDYESMEEYITTTDEKMEELNNKVNRCCNCDDANTSKVVEAAQEQLVAIRVLRDRGLLEKLPQKIAQAAQARENNPEASLSELAAMMEPPITKPAMNHRLQRIVSMAKEVTQ